MPRPSTRGLLSRFAMLAAGFPAFSAPPTEYWAPDIFLDGLALIVYPDDENSGLPSGNART